MPEQHHAHLNNSQVVYVNKGLFDTIVSVTIIPFKKSFYKNKVDIYLLGGRDDLFSSRLAICGLTILSFKRTYHCGEVTVKPGESLMACSEKLGLEYKVTEKVPSFYYPNE